MEVASGESIKLTQYSHGAGCGCKISPQVLTEILGNSATGAAGNLLVGNSTRDDAAVMDLGDGRALISTTDFFMPIVDDPYDFGRIASANAISDVYAMGGKPVLAIAILGWPVDKLSPSVAARVIEGARAVCSEAGIPLAGGHSIDCPEPVFGLAVNGIAPLQNIRPNSTATENCTIYLTKPLGIGVVTTAQKKGIVRDDDFNEAVKAMTTLNTAGGIFGSLPYVKAMTDITGFGLLGHLTEVCQGSNVSAEIWTGEIQTLPGVEDYIAQKAVPGGTRRNWNSYGHHVDLEDESQINVLCDPQTSGGLLVVVDNAHKEEFLRIVSEEGIHCYPAGRTIARNEKLVYVRSRK